MSTGTVTFPLCVVAIIISFMRHLVFFVCVISSCFVRASVALLPLVFLFAAARGTLDIGIPLLRPRSLSRLPRVPVSLLRALGFTLNQAAIPRES